MKPPSLRASAPVLLLAATCLVLGSTGGAIAGSVITGAQIKNGTVTTQDIKDRSLRTADLAPATVKKLQVPKGTLTGYRLITTSTPVAQGHLEEFAAPCPQGSVVISAVANWALGATDPIHVSYFSSGNGAGGFGALSADDDIIKLQMVCARPVA